MKPYVIDRSKLNISIVLALLLIVASFITGYYWALYRTGQLSSNETASDYIVNSNQELAVEEIQTTDSGSTQLTGSAEKNLAERSLTPTNQTGSTQTAPTETASTTTTANDKTLLQQKGKYSVQAGMFGSLTNANKFLNQLKAAGFEAYMQPHQASDGVMRYNVRFGRFATKADAELRLTEYKQGFSTPAYVIINP